MYNCMVSLLKDLGMEQRQAEEYCDNVDNLTELAQYMSFDIGMTYCDRLFLLKSLVR